MFTVIVQGDEETPVSPAERRLVRTPANPRWLLPHKSIKFDTYIAVSVSTGVLFSIAFALYLLVFAAQLHLAKWSLASDFKPLFLASAVLAIGAALLLLCGRKIFRGRIYVLDIGQTLPVLNLRSVGRPTLLASLRAVLQTEIPGSHEYHVLARATEPNVAQRLHQYAASSKPKQKRKLKLKQILKAKLKLKLKQILKAKFKLKQKKLKLKFYAFDAAGEQLMHSSLPAPTVAPKHAARLRNERQQLDFWPVIKLLIGRSLERLPDPEPQQQQRRPDQPRPAREAPGARLYLAAKVFLVPLVYWLLLLAFAMIGPTDDAGKGAWKIASGAMLIVWALGTLAYTQETGRQWKLWLTKSGKGPFGSVPIYLHLPHPTRGPVWEELDQGDFEADIEEYMMEASTVFDYVAAGFLALAIGFLSLL